MTEEKKSLLHRLRTWLFGKGMAHRADQKERRDELSTFMDEHEEEKERATAAQEKRLSSTDQRR